jgi:hypothetical protein
MAAFLHNPSEATLLAAIDRNWRASMRAFGQAPLSREAPDLVEYIKGLIIARWR